MTKITVGLREIMCRLREDGKSYREISAFMAEHYNLPISHTTVRYHTDARYRIESRKRISIKYHRERGALVE